MALGEGGGRTFLFQQRGQAIPSQQQPGSVDQEPEINPMGEGLRATSGQITDYYQAYGNLNAYAKNMWKTHGFDVTRADYTDPEKIKAHDVYLQGAAYVDELKNKLSREASMEDIAYRQSVSDPDFRQGDQAGLDVYDPTLDVQLGTTGRVTTANKLARTYNDKGVVESVNKQINKTREEIKKEISKEKVPSRLTELANELAGLQEATYDPNRDEDQAATAAYRKAQLDKPEKPPKPTDFTARPLEIQEFQSGNIEKAKFIRGGDGEIIYSSVIHNPALGKVYLTRADNKKTEVIDLRVADGGREAINTLFNVGQSEKVTSAQLDGLDKDLKILGTGMKQGLPDIDKKVYADAQAVVDKIKKKEGDDDFKAAASSETMTFVPGTKDKENVIIAPETVILGMRRGKYMAGNSQIITLDYKYLDEDLEEQLGEKKFNMKNEKDLKEFGEFVLFNAEQLGIQVGAQEDIEGSGLN